MTITRRRFVYAATLAAGGVALRPAFTHAFLQGDPQRRGTAQRILILGAGIAGLAAGLKLRELGHDVTILEARSRPGGRVHTLREPFADGLHAEAGAGRIPSTHDLSLAYVERYQLDLDPFYPDSGSEVFLWRGKRLVLPHGADPDVAQLRVNFTDRERKVGFGGLTKLYFERVREEVRALPPRNWPHPGPNPALDHHKRTSYGDFLRAQGASSDAIEYLTQGFADDSVLDYAHDAGSHAVPKMWKIRGGNDLLPRAMAAQLSTHIRYGADVRRIERTDRSVRVTYTSAATNHSETADRVICTIPLTVLRDIEVSPAWSAPKAAAVRQLSMGAVARVFVQTRSRFWEKQGLNGFAAVDRPMELWCPSFNHAGPRGILMSYMYEAMAREYSALDPRTQIERTLELFEQVHPGVRDDFETATTWSWENEPYSRGAFLLTKPGQFELLEHVAPPDGRIHFAGEHASSWPGWIQGALQSGLRAADEVNAAG